MIKFFSKLSRVPVIMLVAAIYSLLGKLGLSLAFFHASATAIWPPSGFALAVVVLLGNRVWPGIFLGAFIVNISTTGDFLSSGGIAVGNTFEAILGAFLVQRFAGGLRAFDSVRNIFRFVVLAAILSTMTSATVGVSSLLLSNLAHWNDIQAIWLTWWLGDLVSILIIAPLLILWSNRPAPSFDRTQIKEAFRWLVPVVIVGLIVFGPWPSINISDSPLMLLELPLFLWIGLQFSQRTTVTAAFVTCAISIWGTLNGGGPFVTGDPNTSLLFLQLFMGILTLTALMMSAVVHERRQTEQSRINLLNLAQRLNSATSAKQAGEIITDTAEKLFGWDACFIHLCNEQRELLFPIINIDTLDGKKTPVPSVYRGVKPSQPLREVFEQDAKLILRKPPFEFRSDAVAFGDTTRPSASLMFVPIRDAKKVIGVFSVQSYTPGAYNNDDLTAFQSLADYCGGALERIRATEELRAAKEKLSQHADELEERVAERTAALKETIASLESFCYTIAHDLRAPLRSLQGFSRFLLDDYSEKLDPIGKDYCRRITASASNMDALIRDLLAYGQLAHKELPLESVDLENLLDEIIGQVAQEIRTKGVEINIKRPIPLAIANAMVIEQAFNNLISNAMKFTPPDRPAKISVWAEEISGKIRLWIEDNGIGIEPKHHERIFQVFERLHENTVYPGTGIGLAIVRKGIERIGGRVGVESEFGKGSRFWIELKKSNEQMPADVISTGSQQVS